MTMSTTSYMCDSQVQDAIAAADIFLGRGTTYLHIDNPLSKSLSCAKPNNAVLNGGHGHNDDHVLSEEHNPTGAVVPCISLATTFRQLIPGEPRAKGDANSFGKGFEYSRTGNPTRGVFERAVAAAEKAKYSVAFSSGSAATSAVIHLLSPGDKVLCIDDVYGGTQRYFRKIVHPRMGIDIDFLDFANDDLLQEKLLAAQIMEQDNSATVQNGTNSTRSTTKRTQLLWLETPTNPTLKVTDIRKISNLAKAHNILLVVDNTFCSPYFQNPLDHGADIVVHSVTKYINGHSDVVMGVVCTNDDNIYEQLRFTQNGVGAVPSPFDCYLAHRGLKTLHVRMEAAARNAMAISLFLERHQGVNKVVYPGLKSHPQHDIAKQQQNGFGAMVTFYCIGGREQSAIILQNLRVFTLAESLGAVESLAECPSLMTHASVPEEHRKILGIDDTLIRLSVGIESCSDLIADLNFALMEAVASMEQK